MYPNEPRQYQERGLQQLAARTSSMSPTIQLQGFLEPRKPRLEVYYIVL